MKLQETSKVLRSPVHQNLRTSHYDGFSSNRAQETIKSELTMLKRFLVLFIGSLSVMGCEREPEPEVVVVEPVEEDEVSYDNVTANEKPAEWDANGDELLDRQEFSNLATGSWQEWDSDRNGALSETEFTSGWTGAGFSDADAAFGFANGDEDAELSAEEWSASSIWTQYDADTSGILEQDEFPYH